MSNKDALAPAPSSGRGFGRVLVAIYGIFALAATARSAVQIATKFSEAPLAYLLSAVAAIIYVIATIALARGDRTSRKVATYAITIELVGVLLVGTASFIFPSAFNVTSVWTGFGSGYGFIPLALPIDGLWWLRHTRNR